MTRSLVLVLVLLSGLARPAGGAVPRSLSSSASGQDHLINEAMRLPLDNRIQALKAQGPRAAERVFDLAFDHIKPLEVRWRAMTVLPYLDKVKGQMAVERALAGDEWYLKNAATLALPALDRAYAVEQSARLLSDPALVVRTAAVQNLLKLDAREKEALLWEKLNSPENFRRGESLWVRRHIARALAELSRPGNESRFVELLSDPDRRLHREAIRGLERLTGGRTPASLRSEVQKRAHWIAWWKKQGPSVR